MARAKGRIANWLGRLGSGIFSVLTRCEENGIMPRATLWLKVGVLGVIASLVISLSSNAQTLQDAQIKMCYAPAPMPELTITETRVSPSPTNGADSVTVKATARVTYPEFDSNFISAAYLQFYSDTTVIPMTAVDGVFSDTFETFGCRLYVGDFEPGTTWVYLSVNTSLSGYAWREVPIWVSEEEKVEKDTIYDTRPPEQYSPSNEQ